MSKANLTKLSITAIILISSFNLASCAGRIKPLTQTTPVSSTKPGDNFYSPPSTDNLPVPTIQQSAVANAAPNTQLTTFKVDQSYLSSWQARGIAVSGGFIYLTAVDTSSLLKSGTVIKMNSSDGKNWKDLGKRFLGLGHPMATTVQGLAISGSKIIAVDSASKAYLIDSDKGGVTTLSAAGGTDVAVGGASVFVANGTVEKTDSGAISRTPITGLSATGGIGADNLGNIFSVSGTVIKKSDTTGQVQDVITSNLASPIDVAVDNRNGDLYVLDTTMVKRFNASGQLLSSFPSSAGKPVSIAIDESGILYIADQGETKKDSKVIKFSASTDSLSSGSQRNSSSSSYGASSTDSYSTYSNTRNTK